MFQETVAAWRKLEADAPGLGIPGLKIGSIGQFIEKANANQTPIEDRRSIVEHAILVIENFYVHYPFKLDRFGPGADPLPALRQILEQAANLSETEFHASVLGAFARLRDVHTLYRLPKPFRQSVAFLPLRIGACRHEPGEARRFFVTHVIEGLPEDLVGAEVLAWVDGWPIEKAILTISEFNPGANDAARFARALSILTVQPLSYYIPYHPVWQHRGVLAKVEAEGLGHDPESMAMTLRFASGEVSTRVFPWGVAEGAGLQKLFAASGASADMAAAQSVWTSKLLWYRDEIRYEQAPPDDEPASLTSRLPEIFEAQHSGGTGRPGQCAANALRDPDRPYARFAYLRIKDFGLNSALNDDVAIAREFRRLAETLDGLAPEGLILDIRSNPGGNVQASERMLAALAGRPIEPGSFFLRNSPAVTRVLQGARALFERRRQIRSEQASRIVGAVSDLRATTGEEVPSPDPRLTHGRHLTSRDELASETPAYRGPIVLLTDALTYSAADIFAAGFEDNQVGIVIGVDESTGGGGATRWRYEDLHEFTTDTSGVPLAEKFPAGANLTVAIRRSVRSGIHQGEALEDHGVTAHIHHPLTHDDLFHSSRDLFQFACGQLSRMRAAAAASS